MNLVVNHIHIIFILIHHWIKFKSERDKLSELKWVNDEVISKSQELQREAYINILNIEQSA